MEGNFQNVCKGLAYILQLKFLAYQHTLKDVKRRSFISKLKICLRDYGLILRLLGLAGTPEGALEAPQYSLYIDESTPLSPIQYRKMLPDVTGDRTKGWAAL